MLNYNVDKEQNQQNSPLKKNVNFEKHYEIVKHLGDGKFGRVYHVRDRANNQEYAAKFIKIKRENDRLDVEREVSILKNLLHTKIVELHDAFSTLSNNVVLIMEIVKGGELFDRIADENYVVSEPDAMRIIKQLCEALKYIHQQNIIHLDIKPENIMLLSQKSSEIKLIDFGLARFFDGKEEIKFMAGTPEFAAPEVIKFENLDFHTDMWSVGVITYILLSGYSPFLGDNVAETYCNVEKGEWAFTEEFECISNNAKDFISKLIVYKKDSRMLPNECLSHPWLLTEIASSKTAEGKKFKADDTGGDNTKREPKREKSTKRPSTTVSEKVVAKKIVRAPTVEISGFFPFTKKNIKRGIIRRMKCESFCVVSTTVTCNRSKVSTKTKSASFTKRKLIAPKRATKRSDDNVLTAQEMKEASIISRKLSKLGSTKEEAEQIAQIQAVPPLQLPLKKSTNPNQGKETFIREEDKKAKKIQISTVLNLEQTTEISLKSEVEKPGRKSKISLGVDTVVKTEEKKVKKSLTSTISIGEDRKKKVNQPIQPSIIKSETKTTFAADISTKKEEKSANISSTRRTSIKKKKDESDTCNSLLTTKREELTPIVSSIARKTGHVDDKKPVECRSIETTNQKVIKLEHKKVALETNIMKLDRKVDRAVVGAKEISVTFEKTNNRRLSKEDVIINSKREEFSFDVLKEKLKQRVINGMEDDRIDESDIQKVINLPSSFSVRDRMLKFEKFQKK